MDKTDFELLQLNDATFPIGGYAFSWGMETFVQQGIINDGRTLEAYVRSELGGSFLYGDLFASRLAWQANGDEELKRLDSLYRASKVPFEMREGSHKLAVRFEKTTEAFGENLCADASYKSDFFPIAYGSYCAKRGMELSKTLGAFLYSQTSARVTTGVKLIPLSQSEGQKILFSLMDSFPSVIEKCLSLSECDFCRSFPSLDIRAMQHEYLYSRLYSS